MAGPRTFAGILPALTGKALGRRGLAFGGLLAEWPSIVGPRMADRTSPYRIVFPHGQRENAVLHLRVATAVALDIQHLEPQIIERINTFFGYKAVARLKLIHATMARASRPGPRPRPLSPAAAEAIASAAATISDEGLSQALARFGRALATAKTPD
ncbi:MAG: DciA family protein [Rhodospirillaceae bacterium]